MIFRERRGFKESNLQFSSDENETTTCQRLAVKRQIDQSKFDTKAYSCHDVGWKKGRVYCLKA